MCVSERRKTDGGQGDHSQGHPPGPGARGDLRAARRRALRQDRLEGEGRRVRLALCALLNILAAIALVPGLLLPLLTAAVRVGRADGAAAADALDMAHR